MRGFYFDLTQFCNDFHLLSSLKIKALFCNSWTITKEHFVFLSFHVYIRYIIITVFVSELSALLFYIFFHRRKGRADDNAEDKHAPNAYEMASDNNAEYSSTAVYSSAVKPVDNGGSQPSAPPPRTSQHDMTLVDNDLYE